MKQDYALKSFQTLEMIHGLAAKGAGPMAVILRHSARHFSEKRGYEAFMGLTRKGRGYAYEMGQNLDVSLTPRFYSSLFGRCIETAFLIDKGFCRASSVFSPHNETCEILAPFYIKDMNEAVSMVQELGTQAYIRQWFDHKLQETIMETPEKTVSTIVEYMVGVLDTLKNTEVALCVSHDWNIFPLKEYKLGQKHEVHGDVGYLEGVAFYQKNQQLYIKGLKGDSVPLT